MPKNTEILKRHKQSNVSYQLTKSTNDDAGRLNHTKSFTTPNRKPSATTTQHHQNIVTSTPKTILVKPRKISVLDDGIDVTPKHLVLYPTDKQYIDKTAGLDYRRGSHGFHTSIVDTTSIDDVPSIRSHSLSITRLKSDIQHENVKNETFYKTSYLTSYVDDVYLETNYQQADTQMEDVVLLGEDGRHLLDEMADGVKASRKIPTHISLILNETPTRFLLDLPSITADKDTDEGNVIESDNKLYEYLTVGKGRNRKVVHVEAQTVPILRKSRNTDAIKVRHANSSSFVSNWEMYDTYSTSNNNSFTESQQVRTSIEPSSTASVTDNYELEDIFKVNSNKLPSVDEEMLKIYRNSNFLKAVCIIERLLANNYYRDEQMRFRGLTTSPEKDHDGYEYKFELLWTFANDKTKAKSITAIEFNESNADLIAVSYGKYHFSETIVDGYVMIWNMKNPSQAEREYSFDAPVSAISFSRYNPHLLAVGLYDGQISIIDISGRDLTRFREADRQDTTFEPVLQLVWQNADQFIASAENGRVCRYTIGDKYYLKCAEIMKTFKASGELKGFHTLKKCKETGISATKFTSASVIALHPNDPTIYYVGTGEGTVHKCSTNYYNQHLDMFLAHNGRVNQMKFSPFANRVFWTSGDDCYIRLWIEGVFEPLYESIFAFSGLLGIDWSPTHSSILITICRDLVTIWDLHRKVHDPVNRATTPSNLRNTICRFTKNGKCVVVGDVGGNVHVYALDDLPPVPFFQYDWVYQCLKNFDVVVISKELTKKFNSAGPLKF